MSLYRPALPIATSALGLLGIGSGIYNFIAPIEGAKGFGLQSTSTSSTASAHAKAIEGALIRVHGIRNIGVGLSTVSLVLFWQFSPLCQSSPLAALAVRRCLGITLTLGTIVGLGDAWILKQFSDTDGVESEAKELASAKGTAHAIMAIVISGLGLTYLLV
ncbi:hypothetical protein EDB81DRAFT_282821 [Dactylonectria macrodidyma]|uniref:Uncharacterized protein n=1 Tax=Dactylonectria macrodidyma TaxID=307937 RepID=A0A9P9FLH1_9HYPO|nr:hypothetical protein EDB81DRAFT_282821 [Dactylonectria macrodidyma]